MTQTLNLTFMSGSRDGEVVQLDTAGSPPSITIGRVAPCELMITDDPDLSRRHTRIFWDGTSWMLEDLSSSNGTYIGEFQAARRLTGVSAIKEGDIFRAGLTRLRLGGDSKNDVVAIAGVSAAAAKG